MSLETTSDRRTRRSSKQGVALRYQLESTLKRGRMAAVALTDQSGLVLAAAGEECLCEELSAMAPVIAHGWPAELPDDTELRQDDVSVRPLECFGEPLYLASVGGGVARDALLAHSARGIHRILTAN